MPTEHLGDVRHEGTKRACPPAFMPIIALPRRTVERLASLRSCRAVLLLDGSGVSKREQRSMSSRGRRFGA